jgi:ParB-like chromosome segregation protein Spo0J
VTEYERRLAKLREEIARLHRLNTATMQAQRVAVERGDEFYAVLVRVQQLLEHARKVSPSERAVIYAADLQAALDGTGPTSIRKTGQETP